MACLDSDGVVLVCRTRWLRYGKTPLTKARALRRELEKLIASFHPTAIAIEHGRPGPMSSAEPVMVKALLKCARANGIPTIRISRRAAAFSMAGAKSWRLQLAVLRCTYDVLLNEIPENSRWFVRVNESFRTVRPKYAALSIAYVLVQGGAISG